MFLLCLIENKYGDDSMKYFLLAFYFFLFFLVKDYFVCDLIRAINVYNISTSDKYLAIESDKYINGEIYHYIFLYDVLKNEKIDIYTNYGKEINSNVYFPSITNDGKYLTFTSRANNITNDVIDKCIDIEDNVVKNCSNIYLYDIDNKKSMLIKYYDESFNGDNYVSMISGNGTDIVFESISSNHLYNEFDCTKINGIKNCINIYNFNISTGIVSLISGYGGTITSSNSVNPSISDDGRFITYQSNSGGSIKNMEIPKYCDNYITNVPEICSNVFLVDTMMNETIILSYDGLSFFNDNSGNAIISGNGGFVAFESYASNISKKNNRYIYIYNIIERNVKLLINDGAILSRGYFLEDISRDGNYLLYRNDSINLDSNDCMHLYVYNILSEKSSLISNDVIMSSFYKDKVYYYNNESVLNKKIDNIPPVLVNDEPIYLLKDNVLSIIDKINVSDNLSNKENIKIVVNNLDDLKYDGEYELMVELIDEFENVNEIYIKVVILSEDTEAPVFYGVYEIKVIKGIETLNLGDYIEAVDNIDGISKIYIINDGGLNLNLNGKYNMIVMSKDSSGNVAYKEVVVVVCDVYNFEYLCEIILVLGLVLVFIFSIIKVK